MQVIRALLLRDTFKEINFQASAHVARNLLLSECQGLLGSTALPTQNPGEALVRVQAAVRAYDAHLVDHAPHLIMVEGAAFIERSIKSLGLLSINEAAMLTLAYSADMEGKRLSDDFLHQCYQGTPWALGALNEILLNLLNRWGRTTGGLGISTDETARLTVEPSYSMHQKVLVSFFDPGKLVSKITWGQEVHTAWTRHKQDRLKTTEIYV